MIDSHCHLDHEPLIDDLENIIARSKKVGVKKLLTICTTLKSFDKIIEIIEKDEMIFGSFGIHPHETNDNDITSRLIVENINNNEKIIGVGETGLDFFYNHSDKTKQIQSFEKHIEASIELGCPIIIHSRNAEKETFDILNKYKEKKPKILMHCFTGSLSFSEKLLDLNAFFSASGIITFKNSSELQNTFKHIPLDKLLIETDSPFLAPVPNRGKKNEPSFIEHTLKKLADLKNVDKNDMINITTQNFNNLFFS